MININEIRDSKTAKIPPAQAKNEGGSFEEQVLHHRPMAHRLGWHLIRRWGLDLPRDDATSMIDYALCEALARFDPSRGAELSTYLYYVLKGELKRLKRLGTREIRNVPLLDEREAQKSEESERITKEIPSCPNPSPEAETHGNHVRELCRKLVAELSEVQRQVVMDTVAGEENVASVARRLGYSRGHLSTLKNSALRRMRRGVRQKSCDLIWNMGSLSDVRVAA